MEATSAYDVATRDRAGEREAVAPVPPRSDSPCPDLEAAARAFEALPIALAVLDRRGRVVTANGAARTEPELMATLGRAGATMARRAIETNAPAGAAHPRAGGVFWVVASPMTQGELPADLVLVAAVDPASPHPAATQLIGDLCGLTPAEAQTARLVLAGESPKMIARTLGVSLATVKTHLHRVFAKTGTAGQPDLARRLARIVAPTTERPGAPVPRSVTPRAPMPLSPRGSVSDLTRSPAHPG
ncbi:MAG: hypothetical protein JNK67_19690 [Alphaproteobacteria bacterium]|nr:hypothetical protein [Alphaproteobacteria bacterium]